MTAFVVVGLATGLLVVSCARRGLHDRMTPERLRTVVEWKVDDVLDDVDADDAQRQAVMAEVNGMLADVERLHDDKQGHHDIIFAEASKDTPDAERLHGLIDEKTKKMNAFAHRALDRLLAVHAILTPDQRAELLEQAEEYHADHHK